VRGDLIGRLAAGALASAVAVAMAGSVFVSSPSAREATFVFGLGGVACVTLAWSRRLPLLVWISVVLLGVSFVVAVVVNGLAPWASVPYAVGLFVVAELGFEASSGLSRPGPRIDASRGAYLFVVSFASLGLGALALTVAGAAGVTGIGWQLGGLGAAIAMAVTLSVAARLQPGATEEPDLVESKSASEGDR
jgi:hypothetical protein